MKSIELRNLRPVNENQKKKVLLINCKRKDYIPSAIPHPGLGILAGILKKRGHEILVVDYLLTYDAPKISYFIEKFMPDVVGITAYTLNIEEVKKRVEEIRDISTKLPIIIGGPHTAMFPEDLKENKNIDYIVLRDGELVIVELIEKAKRQKKPIMKEAKEFVDLDDIPFPDYEDFYKWETIMSYPLYTSRGCPHQCNYCSVWILCKRKWRARNPENCIEELKRVKKIFKKDLHIMVIDDSPSIDKPRFIRFLKLYLKNKIDMRLDLYNVRADNITEELLVLLKKAGSKNFAVAVEHVHPEVCKMMDKAETIEQIENAIKLVKKHGFRLTLFFVIGLPGDNLNRIKHSIKFAQKHEPFDLTWNIFQYTGPSKAVEWFKEHGQIDEVNETKSFENRKTFHPQIRPCAEYSGFRRQEIEKAYFMAILRTNSPALRLRDIREIYKTISSYDLKKDFFYWLPRGIMKSMKSNVHLANSALRSTRKEGFIKTIKKIIYVKKLKRI